MSRRRFGALVLILAFLLGAVLLLSGKSAGVSGSSVSKAPGGLLAARLYLEGRGAQVTLLEEDPAAAALEGQTLVLAGPFQRPFHATTLAAIATFLRGGGRLVYAYSTLDREGHEQALREALGLEEPAELRERAPLSPLAWRRYRQATFRLEPEAESPLRRPLELLAFARAPRPPEDGAAKVYYRAGQGLAPVVFEYEQQRGSVLVLPAPLWSNAELHRAGNADLLELVLERGAAPGEAVAISFDEARHGVVARLESASHGARLGWNVFLLQVLLLYLAALWALGRSFGPAWAEGLPELGSAAAFFEQLGALHQRLRHHRAAARSLVERARALDKQIPAELAERKVVTSQDFLDLAREVARNQHRGGRGRDDKRP